MMETAGSHDPKRNLAAQARDNIPTLAEVRAAAGPQQITETGGVMPAHWPVLADADSDRDPGEAARLAELVKHMDKLCADVTLDRKMRSAWTLAKQWQAIRKITQSNQPNGDSR